MCLFFALTAVWMVSEILLHQSIYADIDPQCTVNCSCCKDQICGPGRFFENGSCKTGCIDGYRGDRCYEKCTFNCKRCASRTDRCSNCYNGYYPGPKFDCTSKCSPGCETCSSEKVCTKCKIYNYNADNSTDCPYTHCTHNCECQNKKCASCKDGFYDITTSCSKSCPDNCVSCTSEETCGKCKDGYFNGYAFDNTSLPHVGNCSHGCRANCRHCTSYESCTQCEPGRYGSICNEICSAGCTSNECLKESGQCTCALNFTGNTCKNCKAGTFGNMCEKSCSSACKENNCDKQSGTCLDGCYICDRNTGVCLQGCKQNFYGDKCCSKSPNCVKCLTNTECEECKIGFYGSTCNMTCSKYCVDSLCSPATGVCTKGCNDTFDKYLCSFGAERETPTSEASNLNVVAVIGAFLAISIVVNITVGIVVVVRKIQSRRREQKHATEVVSKRDTTAVTEHLNLALHNGNESDLERTDTTEYEQLESGQAHGMAAENNTDYYNVNVEND